MKNDNLLKIKELEKELNTLGRKRKDSGLTGNHNKFSDGNVSKKVKHLVLKRYICQTITNNQSKTKNRCYYFI